MLWEARLEVPDVAHTCRYLHRTQSKNSFVKRWKEHIHVPRMFSNTTTVENLVQEMFIRTEVARGS